MLTERGHDVTVLTVGNENVIDDTEIQYELQSCPEYAARTPVGRMQNIRSLLTHHEHRTDVYHSFNTIFHPAVGFYRYRGGETPVVGRLNTYSMFCSNMNVMDDSCYENCSFAAKFKHDDQSLPRKVFETPSYALKTYTDPLLVNHTDQLFAVSPAVKKIYTNIGLQDDLITVAPTAIDPDFTTTEPDLLKDADNFTLLYVGRIEPVKGVDLLLEAVAGLDSVRAEIIGDGSQSDHLRAKAGRLGIEDRVTFHGWVEYTELSPHYHNADLFVHPGRWPEPLGRTVFETLQHDTPAVVSDLGGPPWLVGDAGATFARDDAADLRRTVQEIMNDPSWYESMKSACASELEKVDAERTIDLIESEYARAIELAS